MMKSFLEEVIDQILHEKADLSNQCFILPSKRAGGFLKHCLAQKISKSQFAPKVISIEEFIVDITQLTVLDNTHSLFRFYETYTQHTAKSEQESFETFYGWAQTLIYDFNEIDRYLIDAQDFFNYLSQIQDIKHWSSADEQTDLIKNYLRFWHRLPVYYEAFTADLIQRNEAYQGLVYRKASEAIDAYLNHTEEQFQFIGFNALNSAEQVLIKAVLQQQRGQVYWDTDEAFFNDTQHDASLFLRDYYQTWAAFEDKANFRWIGNHFSTAKSIHTYGIPKNIGQAKQIGGILAQLSAEELAETAVVLNDEAMLLPLLNALPSNVEKANITMGLALSETPLAALFELLFQRQEEASEKIYYKQLIDIIRQPIMANTITSGNQLLEKISKENLVFIDKDEVINSLTDESEKELLRKCLTKERSVTSFLNRLTEICLLLKKSTQKALQQEYLFHFYKVFQKLQNILKDRHPIQEIRSLHRIYKDTIGQESLDFSGSPFDGLQLMGMLETRVLDYKRVIIASVNEGLLPGGKSANSFIPYDLKRSYGLPTYKEKDAVYAYHFYRLLQRAEHVHLLYNNDQTGLNAGEKSRFITQLQVNCLPQHQLMNHQLSPKVQRNKKTLKSIPKTPEMIEKLKDLAAYGFSPSALTTYIRNPIDFYKNYLLGIRDQEEVEEMVAANTLGTIVHDTLEYFYKPLENQELSLADLDNFEKEMPQQVLQQFAKTYKRAPIHEGKNLISVEIAKRYLHNFFQVERKNLQHDSLFILQAETSERAQVHVPQLNFPIYLRGKVDRVDRLGDKLRIVDYKTGKVEARDLKLSDWSQLTADYAYSKAFQVLCYAYIRNQHHPFEAAQAGIISFKNLKNSYLKFTDVQNRQTDVNAEVLQRFETSLSGLMHELFDPEIPFNEKEIE